MKSKINIIAIIALSFLGSACQKKDTELKAKLDAAKKEYNSELAIASKEYDLKVATLKAGKELPAPVIINPAPQKVQVEILPQKGETPVTKVEVVKPIPAQPIPVATPVAAKAPVAVKAPAPAATPAAPVKAPPAMIAAPAAPAPAAPATQTAKVEVKTTTTEAPAAPAAPATPANNIADTLGKGGKDK